MVLFIFTLRICVGLWCHAGASLIHTPWALPKDGNLAKTTRPLCGVGCVADGGKETETSNEAVFVFVLLRGRITYMWVKSGLLTQPLLRTRIHPGELFWHGRMMTKVDSHGLSALLLCLNFCISAVSCFAFVDDNFLFCFCGWQFYCNGLLAMNRVDRVELMGQACQTKS